MKIKMIDNMFSKQAVKFSKPQSQMQFQLTYKKHLEKRMQEEMPERSKNGFEIPNDDVNFSIGERI
jgi:hypothetical protein